MFLLIATIALQTPQIHKVFQYEQVKHLIRPLYNERVNIVNLCDIQMENIHVYSTRNPKHVICAINDHGMHFFTHDTMAFRRCIWDKYLTFSQKKETLIKMLKWLHEDKDMPIAEDIIDFEDQVALSEAIKEVGILIESEQTKDNM